MAYNLLKPVAIFTATAMTSSLTSVIVEIRNQDNIGIQLHWTGAPVGTFTVQISSDHLQDAEGNVQVPGNWVSLVLSPAITASGTPDDAYIDLNQMSAQYVRVLYNFTSGSGTLSGLAVAKGI
jgi:hypothetical protein